VKKELQPQRNKLARVRHALSESHILSRIQGLEFNNDNTAPKDITKQSKKAGKKLFSLLW
jgi:hypothetical protein